MIEGEIYAAEGVGPFPALLLMQGTPGNESDILGLCNMISEKGINALTFNYSRKYQSEGLMSFSNTYSKEIFKRQCVQLIM